MAANSLGERNGAVVFLDPVTGEVLTLVSSPTFDPNLLSSANTTSANNARTDLLNQPDTPLLSRALNEIYAPGSTFKLVTAVLQLKKLISR